MQLADVIIISSIKLNHELDYIKKFLYKPVLTEVEPGDINKYARLDLHMLGEPNLAAFVSLRFRISLIFLKSLYFRKRDLDTTYKLLLKWVKEDCYDVTRHLENIVTSVYTQLKDEESSDKGIQFPFNTTDTSLPEATQRLKYSDYINMRKLSELYDDLMKE